MTAILRTAILTMGQLYRQRHGPGASGWKAPGHERIARCRIPSEGTSAPILSRPSSAAASAPGMICAGGMSKRARSVSPRDLERAQGQPVHRALT
ncbi:MAG: hypothetical protein ACLFP0_12115 [Rhodosalinus sp.]